MHESVRLYVADAIAEHGPFDIVVEFGSRDINGGIRHLFDGHYYGLDVRPGPGVDVVADAATWKGDNVTFDCVVCCEVLEHATGAGAIVKNAWQLLREGGVFVMTCAGPGRPEHSAIDENPIRPDEFYRNVDTETLEGWLARAGFTSWRIDPAGADMRCVAVR